MKSEIAIDFYNYFSFKISCIKTVAEKNIILSERVYQSLKVKCEEAIA